jgi:hypothetical protein
LPARGNLNEDTTMAIWSMNTPTKKILIINRATQVQK